MPPRYAFRACCVTRGTEYSNNFSLPGTESQRAADLLKKDMPGWRVSLFGDRLHVVTDEDAEAGQRRIAKKLEAEGIRVASAREGQFSLEDVFISVVEQARQQGRVASED